MTASEVHPPVHTSVLIIGGGPGGYVAGIRAGQLGLDAIVVDPQPMGGTCLNVGCIPSKALIHAADEFAAAVEQATSAPLGISVTDPTVDLAKTMAWKDGIVGRLNRGVGGLLTKVGTGVMVGTATVIDGKTVSVATNDGHRTVTTDHLVIATGSAPAALPHIPFGDNTGGVSVISSTEALALTDVPASLAVVGGGYIGLELGTAFAKLGSSVTIVEAEAELLSIYDRELTRPITRTLRTLGVEVLTGTRAQSVTDEGLVVAAEDGTSRTVGTDTVLVTVGRKPVLSGFGLEDLGLTMDGPFLRVDEQCRTSMRGVWAIGDVTGEPMLAHRAMKQGEVVAEAIAGHTAVFDPVAIPAIVFSDPEIVTVGLSPKEATNNGASADIVVGTFPLSANGRSMTLNADGGFVRVVARADDHLVLGIQAVGQGVAELAAAFGLALEVGARLEDIADTIHAHPTVGEGFAEAALAAFGHPLHI
jgi:dihydrolipoamide dehydrogenase